MTALLLAVALAAPPEHTASKPCRAYSGDQARLLYVDRDAAVAWDQIEAALAAQRPDPGQHATAGLVALHVTSVDRNRLEAGDHTVTVTAYDGPVYHVVANPLPKPERRSRGPWSTLFTVNLDHGPPESYRWPLLVTIEGHDLRCTWFLHETGPR